MPQILGILGTSINLVIKYKQNISYISVNTRAIINDNLSLTYSSPEVSVKLNDREIIEEPLIFAEMFRLLDYVKTQINKGTEGMAILKLESTTGLINHIK